MEFSGLIKQDGRQCKMTMKVEESVITVLTNLSGFFKKSYKTTITFPRKDISKVRIIEVLELSLKIVIALRNGQAYECLLRFDKAYETIKARHFFTIY